MSHINNIADTDLHFSIDPITRAIIDKSAVKKSLVQFDHNSEKVAFDLPRRIENHDMTECNRVEIHYINISNKEANEGVYEVDDLAVSADDETLATFTWLISQNATKIAGSLNFLIRFACVTDGVIEYVWNTAIYKGIAITNGMNNGDAVVEQYADVLEEWRKRIESGFTVETYLNETNTGTLAVTGSLKIKGGAGVGVSVENGNVVFGIDGATFPEDLKGADVSLPEVTEADNGKILMVVGGVWENVDFPAGTQYEAKTVTIHPSSWNDNGSQIHATCTDFEKNLNGCSIDVSLAASSTKDQFEEAARCGVYCSGADGTAMTFTALYAVPTTTLSFDIRITKPTTLAYSVDDETMTLTIVEGDSNGSAG